MFLSGRQERKRTIFYEWDWYTEKGGKNGESSTEDQDFGFVKAGFCTN